jgi:hypothetical protein
MDKRKDLSQRPAGQSSRVRPAKGPRSRWIAKNGQAVDLPLIVDNINVHAESGECIWSIEARVDLVSGQPELIDMHLTTTTCLDTVMLQRFFRWATPVEIVRRTIPVLLDEGIDPYAHDYATDGYPDAADINRKSTNALSEGFLEEVARQYVEIGRGYARAIAHQRGVSKRTVVSWIQKARRRGILSAVKPGQYGGRVVPKAERQKD